MRKLLSLIRNGATATEQTDGDDETDSGFQKVLAKNDGVV